MASWLKFLACAQAAPLRDDFRAGGFPTLAGAAVVASRVAPRCPLAGSEGGGGAPGRASGEKSETSPIKKTHNINDNHQNDHGNYIMVRTIIFCKGILALAGLGSTDRLPGALKHVK